MQFRYNAAILIGENSKTARFRTEPIKDYISKII